MNQGGSSTTWRDFLAESTTANTITYECDSGLGSPLVADCAQIEWQQLGPTSDSLAVGPGLTRFLHSGELQGKLPAHHNSLQRRTLKPFVRSGTCYIAISAISSIVLNWEQIRTAIITLINVCVQHPFQPAQGGRAFYRLSKAQPVNRGKPRRRDNAGVNGMSNQEYWLVTHSYCFTSRLLRLSLRLERPPTFREHCIIPAGWSIYGFSCGVDVVHVESGIA